MHLYEVVQAPQHTNPLLRLQINVKEEIKRLNITIGRLLTKLLQANAIHAPQLQLKHIPVNSFLVHLF